MAKTGHLPPISELLQGLPFGDVYPATAQLTHSDVDGRTAGLRVLAKYLSEVTITRTGPTGGPPRRFRLPPERFHIEKPNPIHPILMPCVAFVQVEDYNAEATGLNSYVLEDTRDKFGRGTVLQRVGEQTENVLLECWCTSIPQRRAIHEAFKNALSPTEYMSGIRFRMPDYYDQIARFTHQGGRINDDRAGEGRYLLNVKVEMCFTVVTRVAYVEMLPSTTAEVYEGDEDVLFEGEVADIAPG